jgi:hypothetical protein
MRCRTLLACLLLFTGAATRGASQEPPADEQTETILSLDVDAAGDVTLTLHLCQAPSDLTAIETALSETIAQPLHGMTVTGGMLSTRCPRAVPRRGLLFEQSFDLNPLRDALRRQGMKRLRVAITHPPMEVGACPPALPYSGTHRPPFYYLYRVPDGDDPLMPLRLSFGYRSYRLLAFPVLGVLWLTPLVLALWLRQAAVRATGADPIAVWFGTWVWLQRLATATCCVWIAAVSLLDAGMIAHFLLQTVVAVGQATVVALLSLMPPLLALLVCLALLAPVLHRPEQVRWLASCLLRRRVWGYLGVIAVSCFAVLGAEALVARQQPLAQSYFAAGLLAGMAAALGWLQTVIYPQKVVPPGELAARAAELAEENGLSLRHLLVWPAAHWRLINIHELPGGHIYLTDALATHLSKRELDALVAHQLAFLWRRRIRYLWVPLTFGLLIGLVAVGAVLLSLRYDLDPHRTVPFVLPALLLGWPLTDLLLRRYGAPLDRAAVALTGDTEALLTALAKLDRLDLLPVTSTDWRTQRPGDHGLRGRLQALAEAEDIPPERLDEVLAGPGSGGDHYPALPVAETTEAKSEQAFSPAIKQRLVRRVSCLLLGAMVLPLLLVGYLGWREGVRGTVLGLGYALGAAAAWGLSKLVLHGAEWRVAQNVRRQLSARLLREGFRPTEAFGRLVGLSPEPHPRIYHGFFDWDLGTLGLYDEGLVYLGDQTRFRLRREQVTAVRLSPGPPRWWPTQRVSIDWRDEEQGKTGTFNLRYAREQWGLNVRRRGRPRDLAGWLQDWWKHGVPRETMPKELESLTTPATDLARGQSPRRAVGPSVLVVNLIFFALPAGLLAVVMGLPLDGPAWYPPAVLMALLLVEQVPYWRYRDAPRDNGGPQQGPS